MPTPSLQLRRQQFVRPFGYDMGTLNPDTVVEILDYLFNTTSWKTNPDALRRKVTQVRQRLYTDSPGTLSTGITPHTADSLFRVKEAPVVAPTPEDDDPNAWVDRAVALRMKGMGWTLVARELDKPRATLRRIVAKEMDERGLTAPTTAGDD
jgi:hypothetical protein